MFPSVRRLLSQYCLSEGSTSSIASGPKGRLLKGDVLKYIRDRGLKPATNKVPNGNVGDERSSEFVDSKVSNMRRIIAERLSQSKISIPHGYCVARIDVNGLLDLRKTLNATLTERKLSINDFLIKAAALALRQVPSANVTWDNLKKCTIPSEDVDVAIAVALDTGLITPVIRQADRKKIFDVSIEAKTLIKRAKDKKLTPNEYQGGSFSISNLGMYDIERFSAVINPPQAMIVAVGKIVSDVFIGHSGPLVKNSIYATLSYDIRAIEPSTASLWLTEFTKIIGTPYLAI